MAFTSWPWYFYSWRTRTNQFTQLVVQGNSAVICLGILKTGVNMVLCCEEMEDLILIYSNVLLMPFWQCSDPLSSIFIPPLMLLYSNQVD